MKTISPIDLSRAIDDIMPRAQTALTDLPVSKLPGDIFQDILEIITLEDKYKTTRLSELATVCRRWRHIINNTPLLWRYVVIQPVDYSNSNESRVLHELNRIRLALSRCQGIPIDLRVEFGGWREVHLSLANVIGNFATAPIRRLAIFWNSSLPSIDTLRLLVDRPFPELVDLELGYMPPALAKVLLRNASNLRTLDISSGTRHRVHHYLDEELPFWKCLEELRFHGSHDKPPAERLCYCINAAPALRKLSLVYADLGREPVTLSSTLVSLSLSRSALDFSLDLYPAITTLHLENFTDRSQDTNTPLSFPNLRTLYYQNMNSQTLLRIRAPSIEEVDVRVGTPFFGFDMPWDGGDATKPQPIYLAPRKVQIWATDLPARALASLPKVQHLNLMAQGSASYVKFWKALKMTPEVCPKLGLLEVPINQRDVLKEIAEQLDEMIEARISMGLSRFAFSVNSQDFEYYKDYNNNSDQLPIFRPEEVLSRV